MDNQKRLTALVTGGSRGLGRAVAQAFAANGYKIAVHYSGNKSAADSTLASLSGSGHCLTQGAIDSPEGAAGVFNAAREHLGRISVLVNNAGVFFDHPPSESSFDDWCQAWQKTIGVNLFGPAYLSYLAVNEMKCTGGGSIINISSRGAYRGEPNSPAYGASKAGLNSLSQSLAVACAKHDIFVYGIAPGWIETDMAKPYLQGANGDAIRNQSPLGRAAKPEEIARIALFLASGESSFMTGTVIDANGASYLR